MDVTLPQLGEAKSTGVVLNVLVSEGDRVEADQPILELETDKATTEVPAPQAGVVKEILVSKGDEVSSGDKVMVLGEAEEQAEEQAEDEEQAESKGEPKRDAEAESDAESEDESEDESERGADAESKAESKGEPEADAEAGAEDESKADAEAESAPEDGARQRRSSGDGRGARTGDGAGRRPKERSAARSGGARSEASTEASREPAAEHRRPSERGATTSPTQGVDASPAVRKLARELGVDDLSIVAATGRGGRVTEEDVKSHVRWMLSQVEPPAEDDRPRLPDLSQWGPIDREPLGGVRKATAENVARAWSEVVHVTQGDRADVTELDAFRRRWSEQRGVKLTPTAVLVAVVARALQKFERFNAALDLDEGALVLRRYVNVAVAVDTERGLLVPVIRDADDKGLEEVARELDELSKKARGGELRPEQMQGAGFTITNLGGLGTTTFTPIVAWPQVAILGVGRARTEAVHVDDLPPDVEAANDADFAPRRVLPFSLSYDHRAIDGADAARFLRWICRALEQPLTLLE